MRRVHKLLPEHFAWVRQPLLVRDNQANLGLAHTRHGHGVADIGASSQEAPKNLVVLKSTTGGCGAGGLIGGIPAQMTLNSPGVRATIASLAATPEWLERARVVNGSSLPSETLATPPQRFNTTGSRFYGLPPRRLHPLRRPCWRSPRPLGLRPAPMAASATHICFSLSIRPLP